MDTLKRFRITREMAVRIIADALMVNLALLIAMTARYLWLVGVERSVTSAQASLDKFVQSYLSTFWLLTLISLLVFYVSGFYTRGRIYRGRYKLLVITQAVSVSYLVFGFCVFLVWYSVSFPRSVLIIAWVLTLLLLIGARLGSTFWLAFSEAERRLFPSDSMEPGISRVLVIGGAGYIGSALVERLLELGHQVKVLDLLVYGDEPISQFYGHPGFELLQGDFRHIDTVVGATKDTDAIVHLGAIVGDSACSIDQDLTLEINLRATRTIAEIGKGFGVQRFVFASTCSVYGASDEILDERSVVRPISLYGRTKLESERLLLNLTDPVFSPTILRFGTVYGLSGRMRFDLVVNLLTAKAIQEGEAGIFGGKQWRPLVHVRDVAEAIVVTLQAPLHNVRGQIFNVGSSEQNYQIAELGLILKEMVPTARVVTHQKEDNRNYRVSFDKIRNRLNFRPQYTVRDGIREVMDAFATGQVTDYRDARYSNSGFLSLDDRVREVFVEDANGWHWVSMSADEARQLADVVMAVVETRSPESVPGLREGLERAFLGDVDGFITALAGSQAVAADRLSVAPSVDHDAMHAQFRLEGILERIKEASG
jgi:nucleoside-diphosphate-sugar epimerase